ncbi:uncharacterized protein DUF4234 [Natranaerovirga pectinivora]|uniref:Uncharacterized protein DUF4234 n=1 Tax=Natranaerovirga pectinivora TaxID=682400 RepID=A0A4R3MQG1_9FIRM|nr:DUF4234 domain-containing protein [Natranaerovirga pectinivora]TCT16116.1 uncharacterized protein DUF4234 [Natranaerovirga pectinivora]
MEKRSIGVSILLSIITCGIYNLIWMYSMADDLIKFTDDADGEGAGVEILLGIVTCGLYFFYWYYKMGKRIYKAELKANKHASDDSILYLILAIFRLGIISNAIIQSKINQI